MSDFERDEEKLREFLKPISGKVPPEKVMKDYEKQVMARIHSGGATFPVGVLPVFAIMFVVGLAFVGWFVMRQSVVEVIEKPTPILEEQAMKPITTPNQDAEIQEEPVSQVSDLIPEDTADYSTESEEILLNEMSEDLFILEMLGEDSGILDDLSRMETDMEFWVQTTAAVGV